ncbi:MAG TPA: ABC transporter ATP-binding protein [Thermotogales bacterium]|nr:ABC transporter ATP-binding protein [Thermotogales bacterium]
MSSIRFENVTKKFKYVTAVDGISFEIKHGEFVVMLGPTGAGKTTTLKLTAGIYKPDSGTIYFDDEPVNDLHPALRDVAFVFQNYILYPNMSVYDNLAFPLRSKIRKVNKDDVDKIVREIARLLHIDHLLSRGTDRLSGGEQQRVALGRALVRKPRVFLMDEPLSNLDAKLREEMRTELKRIHNELNETFFFVTHDYTEAFSMADRIIVLNHGKIEQIGTPDEIYEKPASLFVASFVSSPPLNVFEVEKRGEEFLITSLDERIRIGYPNISSLPPKFTVAIRPEDLRFSSNKNGDEIFEFPMEIYVIEDLGTFSVITLKYKNLILRQKSLGMPNIMVGDKVWISADGPIFLFDPHDGRRLL